MLSQSEKQKLKKKLMDEFEAALEKRLAQLPSDRAPTLDEIEAIACELREEMGRKLAQMLSQDVAKVCQGSRPPQKAPCSECQHLVQKRGSGKRTILTMAGDVHIGRAIYYCRRCDVCTSPVDQQLHLPHHGFSAQVERTVARICAQESFEHGMREFQALTGLSVSAKEAQRITGAVGEYARQSMSQDIKKALSDPDSVAEQKHDPKLTIYVLLDGIHTPMRKGKTGTGTAGKSWSESKVGCVCVVDQASRRKVYYTHHMGTPNQIGKQLLALAAQAGVAECARVIALGDGAPWIWRQITLRFPHAIQILDFYHACEHLSAVVKACMNVASGAEIASNEQAEPWREKAVKMMRAGQFEELMAHIRSLPAGDSHAAKIRRTTIAYFRKHRERMRYNEYEDKGWSIGSGQIESGCKQVVGKRLKQPGMHWGEKMVNAVGALRCLVLSHHRWDEVIPGWNGRPALARAA